MSKFSDFIGQIKVVTTGVTQTLGGIGTIFGGNKGDDLPRNLETQILGGATTIEKIDEVVDNLSPTITRIGENLATGANTEFDKSLMSKIKKFAPFIIIGALVLFIPILKRK